jgi:hypothetical protein
MQSSLALETLRRFRLHRHMRFLILLLLVITVPVRAAEPTAREIIERAYAAAGGDAWANVRSLALEGSITFYAPESPTPRWTGDDYRMLRIYEENRTDAHGEAGLVRIDALSNGRIVFQNGSDGTTSWNHKGVIPTVDAATMWANNFGFGIIRHVLKPGFTLTRLPDDSIDGHPSYMVRVTDPSGTQTLFGVDKARAFIRLAGFATPKGWHVRVYDDFAVQPGWTQPRSVTLYYNGVKQNVVNWERWRVNPPLDRALFAPANAGRLPTATVTPK